MANKMTHSDIMTRAENAEKSGVGKRCVQQAREFQRERKESTSKEVYQSAKEAATYLIGQSKGRVSFTIDPNDYDRIFGRNNDKKHNG